MGDQSIPTTLKLTHRDDEGLILYCYIPINCYICVLYIDLLFILIHLDLQLYGQRVLLGVLILSIMHLACC